MSNISYLTIWKPITDRVVAALLLIATSWIFLLIILAYLFSFQWPIFFTQDRVGFREKVFGMIKFRTLTTDESKPLTQRRFLLGNVLRFLNLDELPQLLNVLKGEMSLIGPRPLPIKYLPLYDSRQRRRHQVLPGVTGWAQVNGRHAISWKEKFDLDLFYVEHVTPKLDLVILLRTIVLILRFKSDVSLSEEEFTGNK